MSSIAVTHIPNGEMCIGCTKVHEKCNHLPFSKMQVIDKRDPAYPVVKCDEYVKQSKNTTN